jgi:hypothetical protein
MGRRIPEEDVMSSLMPANVHTVDRGVRVVLGLGLGSLLFVGPVPGWGLVGLVGLILLGTAAVGSCPIYTALGLSTNSTPTEA